jgi:hypothetical protein
VRLRLTEFNARLSGMCPPTINVPSPGFAV